LLVVWALVDAPIKMPPVSCSHLIHCLTLQLLHSLHQALLTAINQNHFLHIPLRIVPSGMLDLNQLSKLWKFVTGRHCPDLNKVYRQQQTAFTGTVRKRVNAIHTLLVVVVCNVLSSRTCLAVSTT
jgi:hypothetical protein